MDMDILTGVPDDTLPCLGTGQGSVLHRLDTGGVTPVRRDETPGTKSPRIWTWCHPKGASGCETTILRKS